jgi:hypothetical protein
VAAPTFATPGFGLLPPHADKEGREQ